MVGKNLVAEYLFYHEKFEKKYGIKTLVLMEVGSFLECYGTETRGPNLTQIAELLNIICTRADKTNNVISESNPYMVGFPSPSRLKYMGPLISNGYTIILVEQTTRPPAEVRRAVTGIYSQGTMLDQTLSPDSNNICCIYIEDEAQLNGKPLLCVGMSVIDLTTGYCTVHESYSLAEDDKLALDEAIRFISSFSPKELIIYRKNDKDNQNKRMSKEQLLAYLELDNKPYHYLTSVEKHFFKIQYQNEFLGTIYKNKGIISPIEHLNLHKSPYSTISFIILLDYAHQHSEKIIKNLYEPKLFTDNQHLILGNNAIYQLNLVESTNLESYGSRFRSLFDVINGTSTPMGRRLLKSMLMAPMTSVKEINATYDQTEQFIQNNFYLTIETHLKEIADIDRLYRRMVLNIIHPFELHGLIESYKQALKIIATIKTKCASFKTSIPDKATITIYPVL